MTVYKIFREGRISRRSFNVCRFNDLDTLEKIKAYYDEHRTFDNLRNCGAKSNRELIAICQEPTEELSEDELATRRMSLEEIFAAENISVRAYNICVDNHLTTIKALGTYFFKNRSFFDLRNCGSTTNDELIAICEKYFERFAELYGFKNDSLGEEISGLSRIQRDVINSYILVNTNGLSVRSKNALTSVLEDDFRIKNFAEKILLVDEFTFDSVQNVGKKSVAELNEYVDNVRAFLFTIRQLDSEKELIALKNTYLVQKAFSIEHIPPGVLEAESIFRIVGFLLEQQLLFKGQKRNEIFGKALRIYQDQPEQSLDDVAALVGVTRERVRQLKNKCLEELFDQLVFLQNFNDDLYRNYHINTEADYIKIDEQIASAVQDKAQTGFSKGFIAYVLYVYLKRNFSLILDVQSLLALRTSSKVYDWNNHYLIKKEIAERINFEGFVNDVFEKLNERIDETYSLHFKAYLSRFMSGGDISILNEGAVIGEQILNEELDLFLDVDENIVFARNTPKRSYEYAYEALEYLGYPSTVEDITETVMELYPAYETDNSRVRNSMKREYGFIPIGRESVYGLKKWEEERDDFKGGTIREIVREYLLQFSEPKSMTDITEYVLQYRPETSEDSIYGNLKLEETGMFVFYENQLVGLYEKEYDSTIFKVLSDVVSTRRTWEESFEALKDFVASKKRLPRHTTEINEEGRLYRWLSIQKQKIRNGGLDGEQKLEIQNLLNTLNHWF